MCASWEPCGTCGGLTAIVRTLNTHLHPSVSSRKAPATGPITGPSKGPNNFLLANRSKHIKVRKPPTHRIHTHELPSRVRRDQISDRTTPNSQSAHTSDALEESEREQGAQRRRKSTSDSPCDEQDVKEVIYRQSPIDFRQRRGDERAHCIAKNVNRHNEGSQRYV